MKTKFHQSATDWYIRHIENIATSGSKRATFAKIPMGARFSGVRP